MRLLAAAGVGVLAVSLTGCASAGARYRAAAATETFSSALVQAQLVVMEAYAQRQIPQEQYLRWQAAFLSLARTGRQLTAALRSNQEPAALDGVLGQVTALMGGELTGLPDGVRTPMRVALEAVRVSALLMAMAGKG